MSKKIVYTTLIEEDANHIIKLLEDSGFKPEFSHSQLNNFIYLNSAAAKEFIIYIDELFLADAKSLLVKNEISPHEASIPKKIETDYLHDSLRLAIFGMVFVPILLNLLSVYKLVLAILAKEKLKPGRLISIIVLNTVGICFWSIIVHNKYLS